jgi:Mn-dependent DtxR family transcriptional regulator
MTFKAPKPILTKSQAACFAALTQGRTKTEIALQAKLDLYRTSLALEKIASLGLAERDETNHWNATARARNFRFKTVPDRARRNSGSPGQSGRRLLALLDRPMRGREIAEKLGVTIQRVHQLAVRLHAKGLVRFGDPYSLLTIVARADETTPLLSREEERVLWVMPNEYATNITKTRVAAGVPESRMQRILERLIAGRLIEARDGLNGDRVYRIAAAGLRHPQGCGAVRSAEAPRLPVESDRICMVLAAIRDAGPLRIKEVRDGLKIPQNSINALMQYLKRKALVRKIGEQMSAPYALTQKGDETLAEMTRRRAA